MRCMMLDHTEHKKHFIKYDQGIKELQNNAKKLKNNIKDEMNKADKSYKEIDRKYQNVTEREIGLTEQRKQLVAQLKECDEYLKQTASKKEVYKNLKDKENQWTVAATSLNGLITSKSGFCENYVKIKQKADQCLRDMKKMTDTCMEYTLPKLIPVDPSSVRSVKRMMTEHEVKNLKILKTLRTIEKSYNINCGNDAAFIGSDVLFPSFNTSFHVIRLNKEDTQKKVLGVDVYNNDIYMLQDKTITVITHREENNIIYNINRNNMSAVLVKDKTTIFVSQEENPGGIFKYDTVKGTKKSVVQGLKTPTFLSRVYTSEGYRYIVTELGAHCIKVYNDRWELLHSFEGYGTNEGLFNAPTATAATGMGTLLVADYNNHRISHYSLDGQFLSHVVTKHDGLLAPFAMIYSHPYLWVCCDRVVKCFELKKL